MYRVLVSKIVLVVFIQVINIQIILMKTFDEIMLILVRTDFTQQHQMILLSETPCIFETNLNLALSLIYIVTSS